MEQFELKKLNVHKLVSTVAEKEKLICNGFTEIVPIVIKKVVDETVNADELKAEADKLLAAAKIESDQIEFAKSEALKGSK